ncbi:unnamed protein product, partial [Polarella glacialis]
MGDKSSWTPQGPVKPPVEHPFWQGSISHANMDRTSGLSRGTVKIDSYARDGVCGVAQQGLGGYMCDVRGKLSQDFLNCKKAMPNSQFRSDEYQWRSSRRTCTGPTIQEPDKFSYRPPFVPRHGSYVTLPSAQGLPPVYDSQVEHFNATCLERSRLKRLKAAKQEVREAQRT